MKKPPWRNVEQWTEVNESIGRAIEGHSSRLRRVFEAARDIRGRLIPVFEVMDELCRSTCSRCPDPCCLHAVVWIDFKDLLFLHLSGERVPSAQIISDFRDTCRFAGPKGCRIDRISRPWICTRYVCPTQTALLRKTGRNGFLEDLRSIRDARNLLEDEFCRALIAPRYTVNNRGNPPATSFLS